MPELKSMAAARDESRGGKLLDVGMQSGAMGREETRGGNHSDLGM